MTTPTNHVKRHADRAREHMTHAQREAQRIQLLADQYIADQQPQPPTVESEPSQSQQTDSTPASSSA